MSETFAELFEESLNTLEFRTGTIVSALVVSIENNYVIVDAGLKSEAAIPAEQFKNPQDPQNPKRPTTNNQKDLAEPSRAHQYQTTKQEPRDPRNQKGPQKL